MSIYLHAHSMHGNEKVMFQLHKTWGTYGLLHLQETFKLI